MPDPFPPGRDDATTMAERVEIDEFGRLRVGDRWVALTRTEERMMRYLLPRFGRVVPLADVVHVVWPGEANWQSRLHSRLRSLRRRLTDVDLAIVGVRGRGPVLCATGSAGPMDRSAQR
jgi:DNA-binding winged helix-turn-helix (wHTH) protein